MSNNPKSSEEVKKPPERPNKVKKIIDERAKAFLARIAAALAKK